MHKKTDFSRVSFSDQYRMISDEPDTLASVSVFHWKCQPTVFFFAGRIWNQEALS